VSEVDTSSFKRILVATDLSETSLDAVRVALEIASSGDVAVCHVVPAHAGVPAAVHGPDGDLPRWLELEAQVRTELAKRLDPVLGERDVTLFVERGEPYAEIIRRAEAFAADLLVVGNRGHTGLDRILLGSVAERVVRYAHGPVLLVRNTAATGVVLAATDLSDPSLPAVSAGAAEARRRKARLVLLHVVDQSLEVYAAAAGGLLGAIGALPPPALQDERRRALETTLTSALEREGVPGEALVVEGNPAVTISEKAKELRAELVVVGTHGRTGLSRIALGSVAERVVRAAPCTVLAIRLPPSPV
jgi:nucleotide-binding universal stress UspA family protein